MVSAVHAPFMNRASERHVAFWPFICAAVDGEVLDKYFLCDFANAGINEEIMRR